jgi:hypothetical protein
MNCSHSKVRINKSSVYIGTNKINTYVLYCTLCNAVLTHWTKNSIDDTITAYEERLSKMIYILSGEKIRELTEQEKEELK